MTDMPVELPKLAAQPVDLPCVHLYCGPSLAERMTALALDNPAGAAATLARLKLLPLLLSLRAPARLAVNDMSLFALLFQLLQVLNEEPYKTKSADVDLGR